MDKEVLVVTIIAVSYLNLVSCVSEVGTRNRHLSNVSSLSSSAFNKAKWLPFLVVIDEVECTTDDGSAMGTCLTAAQCYKSGGNASGSKCASGFGICCITTVSCGATVTTNRTYFNSPNYPKSFMPSETPHLCKIKFRKPDNNICQLRLDFDVMELAPQNSIGHCTTDNFSIYGSRGITPPHLCGALTGQHLYIELASNREIYVSISTGAMNWNWKRSWSVRMMYIKCDAVLRPPAGCLQYFTEPLGSVKIIGYPSTPHLADLKYSIRIRKVDGAGSIMWFPCRNEPVEKAFLMLGSPQTLTTMYSPDDCNSDYITIMSDTVFDKNGVTQPRHTDRYCGNALTPTRPFVIHSTTEPFVLFVRTDSDDGESDVDNTGFCLDWLQIPKTKKND